MSDTPENIYAILAEMRDFCSGWSEDTDVTVKVGLIYGWMCRIEAAAKNTENAFGMTLAIEDGLHKRDKQSAPVNAAAMRAALENARSKFIHIKKCADEGEVSRKKLAILCEFVSQEIATALAAPPRNCDVGTAEEQAHRFHAFCSDNTSEIEGMCNSTCPCINCGDKCHCLCVWSQMPFVPAKGGRE